MLQNRWFYVLVTAVVLAVVGLTFKEALATGQVVRGDAERWIAIGDYYLENSVEAEHLEQSWAADGARWAAMGGYFAAQQSRQVQEILRSRAAEAARWQALGKSVPVITETVAPGRLQTASSGLLINAGEQSQAAETARWTAMGKYYTALQVQESMTLLRAREAYAARWSAIGTAWSR